MLLTRNMNLELVGTVAVKLAGIAPKLYRVDASDEPQLPLVGRPALFDVIDVAEPLKVFVCFAMELKIGFQVGLVVAKLAQVVASNNH